jgi:hypothetical protein
MPSLELFEQCVDLIPFPGGLFPGKNEWKKASFHYRKSRLKAHGFNRGMKGVLPGNPFLGMVRATNLLYNRTYERCSSHS